MSAGHTHTHTHYGAGLRTPAGKQGRWVVEGTEVATMSTS